MDMNLYTAGKQLLLSRQEALRSAGQLQMLPQLNVTKSKVHQRSRPADTSHGQTGMLVFLDDSCSMMSWARTSMHLQSAGAP